MILLDIFKAGDMVSVQEEGRAKICGCYWYRALTGKHVVFLVDKQGSFVRFCTPGSVWLDETAQDNGVKLPEWAP